MNKALKTRGPSPLQKNILIILAGLEQRGTDRVRTRDLEKLLERGSDRPVYGNNLRASCRRMEAAGWLRTLRAPNLQLAVELTDAGREIAVSLLADEQAHLRTEQRATQVHVLPLVREKMAHEPGTSGERPVQLDGMTYMACRGDFVVRLDGSTCLQLWNAAGQVTRLDGDPLQVAQWLQACHDAGLALRVQVNESHTPEKGGTSVPVPGGRTDNGASDKTGHVPEKPPRKRMTHEGIVSECYRPRKVRLRQTSTMWISETGRKFRKSTGAATGSGVWSAYRLDLDSIRELPPDT